MKTLAIIISLFSLTFSKAQDSLKTHSITVKVPHIYQEVGVVIFSLHNEDTFMKQPLQAIVSKIESKTATAVFTDIPAGDYAVLVLHDKNENNKMDFNESGMPMEDYGVSNNIMAYGPPKFQDAKIEVNKDLELEIRF